MSENAAEQANSIPEYPNDPPQRVGRAKRRSSLVSWLMEIVIVLVLALVVSTLLRQFVVQVFSIPSSSMVQTLQVGDRIIVNRLPVIGKQIERGDVVVFNDAKGWMPPAANKDSVLRSIGEFIGVVPGDGEQVIVKRVIGVGGDQVSCSGPECQIEVNGQPIQEDYLGEGNVPSQTEFSVTVPEGELWVMGDNRSGSADSRAHLDQGTSFIEEKEVIGKVAWVAWPFSHWSSVSHRQAFADVPDPS